MTTWHEYEPLQEDFWFAKETAHHPKVKLDNILVLQGSPFEFGYPPVLESSPKPSPA